MLALRGGGGPLTAAESEDAISVHDLLERQTTLAELAGLTGRAAQGAGSVVLLRGEAGVGKTAVIARFLEGLDRSWPVLRGWCDPLAAPRPLGPLIDALDGLGGPAAGALGAAIGSGDTTALYARLLAALRGGQRWVWVIEDAHWADGATLDLLRFVVRRIASLPVLLVVSYRDDELDDQHPLSVALGDVASCASVTRIGLEPLSREAVAVLAAGSGVNADHLHRLTGGNPFYVTEILAAGPEALRRNALPRSVAEAVWGRLGRLSEAGRDIAHTAAVCGPRVDAGLLESVCPGPVSALTECLSAGVLVTDGDVVGFRHELARRATLEQIPEYQRRVLHKRALAALAEPPINPDALAALAFHAEQAGDTDAVIRHGPAAAARASSLGANREAAELYALTLRHADTVPDEQKVTWLEQHAFTGYLSGLGEAAVSSWDDAIALRHKLGDRIRESEDLHWLSHQLYLLGRTSAAIEAAAASLRLLEKVEPCPQLAWSLATMTVLAAFGFDPACHDYAARSIAVGTHLGDNAVVVRATFFARLSTVLRSDTGWDPLEAAWRDSMATGGLSELGGLNGGLICWFAAVHHHLERAEAYISETTAFCATHDLGMFGSITTGAAALVALHRGNWASALAYADDVLTRPALPPPPRILPLICVALIRARRGEQPAAAELDEALAAADPGDLCRLGVVWAARAEAAWLAGDDDSARAEAHAGLAAATEHADPWLVGHLRRWAYLAGGSLDDGTVSDTVTPYRLEVSGDWQTAAEEWTRRGCPYDTALAQLGGDIAAVESALATFRLLGARAAVRRAQQRLAALRGRTLSSRRADTLSDPDGLTRRQREVLELLADGRSDTEIAAALHISPKTAGCHVSSILAKLGVDNRIQAAARALQRQTASTA
jgi:DNA-binding CsgD family transcriptional regulator